MTKRLLLALVVVGLTGCAAKPYICVPGVPSPSMICWPATIDDDTGMVQRDIDLERQEFRREGL